MVDEQEPTKRVVKRVVKKTVVRPTASKNAAGEAPIRYGRPVATATKPQAKAQSKPAAKSSPQPKPQRPSLEVGAKIGAAGHRVSDIWWSAADAFSGRARRIRGLTSRGTRTVAAWRLPHINLYLAAAITGAVVGIISVALGLGALSIFKSTRGVASGGGLWGGLTFLGVALVAAILGQLLLSGFGSHSARLTSILGVILTIVAMLSLFLDVADTSMALALVPVLGAVTYVAAHWLIDLAENSPNVVD